ncbi:MAG: FIST C-terminal domain-containing protein [Nitrospinae bacterium]|nr:FIST C-terminal domain-containing protein [Nitrospinota bacterium]
MKIEQRRWFPEKGWQGESAADIAGQAQLVFVFGDRRALETGGDFDRIKEFYPRANIVGCSSSGEISGSEVTDGCLAVTAVVFERARVETAKVKIEGPDRSYEAGEKLAGLLDPAGLDHVMIFSDGLMVNGSELVKGLKKRLAANVGITGGLAGDGTLFQRTLVCCGDAPEPGKIAAVGFYGPGIKIGFGSMGGWVPFGPERAVTRSQGNVLFELDGAPAVELYKKYLGEEADDLSANRFYFPLSIRLNDGESGVVRTILAVNEQDKSLTFAGDVPQGTPARLMKAKFEMLVDGSAQAAHTASRAMGSPSPDLAILFSCVGRKIVLKQRVEEEVECVRKAFGQRSALTGFYSYGEIGPFDRSGQCQLHNQTMTITAISEE